MPESTIVRFVDEELEKKELIEIIVDLITGARRAALRQELGALRPSELIRRAQTAGTNKQLKVLCVEHFPSFSLDIESDVQDAVMRTSMSSKKSKLASRRSSRF